MHDVDQKSMQEAVYWDTTVILPNARYQYADGCRRLDIPRDAERLLRDYVFEARDDPGVIWFSEKHVNILGETLIRLADKAAATHAANLAKAAAIRKKAKKRKG